MVGDGPVLCGGVDPNGRPRNVTTTTKNGPSSYGTTVVVGVLAREKQFHRLHIRSQVGGGGLEKGGGGGGGGRTE